MSKNGISLHAVKRLEISKAESIVFRLLAVLLSLVTAGLVLLLIGYNPLEVYSTIINGALGTNTALKETIKVTFPLLMSALAAMIAFKMKFWNIGVEGQICIGAIAASYFAYRHSTLPSGYMITFIVIAGIIGGGIFALIPAFFKTKYNTNETLFTLMLNYIAVFLIQFFREGPWRDPESLGFPIMPRFPKNARMPLVFGVHFGWIVAVVLVVLIYVYIKYTKQGYELRVVGENRKTAEYAGMPVSKIILRTMFISGAIAGLAGAFQVSGADRQLTETVAGGVGFTGIIIAWLGRLSSPTILLVSILFGILTKGAGTLETALKIPATMSGVIQGLILFFVLGAEFFINYKIVHTDEIVRVK
ncbi:MAG: ABC transporter permease [Eubacteriales bacterium]|nr:ABC transporter permease [Eubacteriales bacterium]